MTRALPSYLAPIVEELELEQAFLVTTDDLDRIILNKGLRTETALAAQRLRQRGWLLKTAWPGIWEFAPGAHAGPIGRGHPFREVLAARLAEPNLDVTVCLISALWAHGLLDRTSDRPEVAIPKDTRPPRGLTRTCRVVRFEHRLPTVELRDAPVHQLTTILVHLAARPSDVRSWGAILEVLPELVHSILIEEGSTTFGLLSQELEGRPASVKTRLAYLVHGVAPNLAATVKAPGHGKVWFGPRGPLRRHHAGFDVADTVLPISPGDLTPVEQRT